MLISRYKIIATNLALTCIFTLFVYIHLNNLLLTGKVSLLITVVAETILIVIFLIRKDPISATSLVYDYFIAIFGTFIVLLYRPSLTSDVLPGQLLLMLGGLLLIVSYFSLNKSFGIVPANRGIKTHGSYSLVRHPIYLGYFLTYIGYYINNPSWQNLTILSVALVTQVLRIIREEAHLLQDNNYQIYTKQVQWRLIPYLF